jgi:hypothetical protein
MKTPKKYRYTLSLLLILILFANCSLFKTLDLPKIDQKEDFKKTIDDNQKMEHLIQAFDKDSFNVAEIVTFQGKVGILAKSRIATDYSTKLPKKAYYVEGSNYQMGYLLGLLAEDDITQMAINFADEIVLSAIHHETKEPRKNLIGEIIIDIVYELSIKMEKAIPVEYLEELEGILDGCKKANPKTEVDKKHLWVLNVGIDVLTSLIYTGDFLLKKIPDLKPHELKLPMMCNGFSVFGDAAGGNHFLGRDFMFSNANVFQDAACMIIYNPDSKEGSKRYPLVSMCAPGMMGCIAGLNSEGVGIGVDMATSGNCNPKQPGFNSLLLARHSIQYGDNVVAAKDSIVAAQRGVSWFYIIGDGKTDSSCVVESSANVDSIPFWEFPSNKFYKKGLLPDKTYLHSHPSTIQEQGVMVRWHDFEYPEEYINTFNQGLWDDYNKEHPKEHIVINPDAFGEQGFIDSTYTDKNIPSSFYFAPQRETLNNLVFVTNHYIIPEMRLTAMYPWTAMIFKGHSNDVQWRYDELNKLLLNSLPVDTWAKARQLIGFLAPYGPYPDDVYPNPDYYKGPLSKDGKKIQISGSNSVLDLKKKIMYSHYGYYCDEWVQISLENYID